MKKYIRLGIKSRQMDSFRMLRLIKMLEERRRKIVKNRKGRKGKYK